MKYPLLLCWLLVQFTVAYSQQTAMFETKFCFEDSAGNRDTIFVGFDTSANYIFNPQFGEVEITDPFDSVFEVRAVHGLDFNWTQTDYLLSKKIVVPAENYVNNPDCYGAETIQFLIRAKYQPIKIKWDKSAYADNNFCVAPSFLTPDKLWQLINPVDWLLLPGRQWGCTSKQDSFVLSLGSKYMTFPFYPYGGVLEVEGIGLDTVWAVALHTFGDPFYSPCQFVSTTKDSEKSEFLTEESFSIQPNPAEDLVILVRSEKLKGDLEGQLVDASGKLVQTFTMTGEKEQIELMLENLPTGVYFIFVRNDHFGEVQRLMKT